MIIITGTVVIDPTKRDDAEDANRIHFFEQWRDMDTVQRHFAVP
ncbi:hypothetical protein [Altererythrobacter rubellus]|uniref:Antibiotic biosynthesis monooxygenase n=1 Tax=Altererythrobacter rubellus TaxID=2173831 RepID=A0A9Y2B6C3_9SPHN|nr:hypothetical protein [Altererythrobacter rubellus]WIW94908.1 hypothetical protein QQX03_07960 [Altererythrobacter rubellus]